MGIALGLVLGGAISNLIDRLTFHAVFDFLDIHRWPVFNVADIAITIGGGLLFIYWLRVPRNAAQEDGTAN